MKTLKINLIPLIFSLHYKIDIRLNYFLILHEVTWLVYSINEYFLIFHSHKSVHILSPSQATKTANDELNVQIHHNLYIIFFFFPSFSLYPYISYNNKNSKFSNSQPFCNKL